MVLFFDSGVGGLAYLEAFRRRRPNDRCAYLADDAFFPYGEKEPATVRERVVSLVTGIEKTYPLSVIVLACNTASVVALGELREGTDTPVVGVVPAVKPAAEATATGHIAVLATNRTVDDPYTEGLVRQFARYCRVTRLGLPRLVVAAEKNLCGERSDEIERVIREDVTDRLEPDVDTVVLACTHFVPYRQQFERALGGRIAVVDSLDGVTRRIAHLLNHEVVDGGTTRTRAHADASDRPIFFRTGDGAESLSCLEERYEVRVGPAIGALR